MDSKNRNASENVNDSEVESSAYNFPKNTETSDDTSDGNDPFTDFGAKIDIGDGELPF